LHKVVAKGHIHVREFLVQHFEGLNVYDFCGSHCNSLRYAAEHEHWYVVKFLLSWKPTVQSLHWLRRFYVRIGWMYTNIYLTQERCTFMDLAFITILEIAARFGHVDVLQYLVANFGSLKN